MTSWSAAQLAAALKLTPPRISQLCKSGVLPQPVQGKHDPFKAVPAYISFISQRVAGGDLKGARIAKYAVETALRELELKQKSGELVEPVSGREGMVQHRPQRQGQLPEPPQSHRWLGRG